eukprot:scaffold210559_cov17-Tisochrysis_lutea.AAC.1
MRVKASADSTSVFSKSQQQHQAHEADQESDGSTYADIVALCRLFISDITCQGLQDFTSAWAFLDSETAVHLLQVSVIQGRWHQRQTDVSAMLLAACGSGQHAMVP